MCYGSRHPTDAPCARAWAHDHLRTFDPLYSYRNLLVTTPVTFFIDTCRECIARPADFTCCGALAYGNIPQYIFRYVSRSIISEPILYSATLVPHDVPYNCAHTSPSSRHTTRLTESVSDFHMYARSYAHIPCVSLRFLTYSLLHFAYSEDSASSL